MDRKNEILEFIKSYYLNQGMYPSIRDIGEGVGLKSSSSVQYQLNKLLDEGLLTKNSKGHISLVEDYNNFKEQTSDTVDLIPVIGKITAGIPILAMEEYDDFIPISKELSKDKEVFSLRVSGESMIDAHICDGDLIIIEKTQYVKNGDIVAALIEDEATVKRFFKHSDHVELRPENESYESIRVKDVKILGKVIGLQRNIY